MSPTDPRLPDATIESLLLDTSPYLSCDECFERIDAYVERQLADPAYQDLAMQRHLAACGACADEAEAMTEVLRSFAE